MPAILRHLTNLQKLSFSCWLPDKLLSPTLLDGISRLNSLQCLGFNISVSMELHHVLHVCLALFICVKLLCISVKYHLCLHITMQDFVPFTDIITSLQTLSSLQTCVLISATHNIASFNNVLQSLPVGLQALSLKSCPLHKNTQFVQILRQFTQLLGLELSTTFKTNDNHIISFDDIQSLVTHPPASLRWFRLADALIEVTKCKEEVHNAENRCIRTFITKLIAAAFPLRRCPVADCYWSIAITEDD